VNGVGDTPKQRRRSQAGISRAALTLAVAVIAAALVLVGGAIRSSPNHSPLPSAAASEPASIGSLSLPPTPTLAPTIATTPAPEPTAIADLRGEFVGPLGHVESCPILYERDGALELALPDGYGSRIHGGAVEIVDPGGAVIASEGDLIGVNGKVGGSGSTCLVGTRLRVSKFVEVRHRGAE
jgi:hypothetical protein